MRDAKQAINRNIFINERPMDAVPGWRYLKR
uniref:Uncharacterized protein n=1 Tax=Candidatus Kentrum sp. MB TaxID=2138164 RepID=A0A451BFC0_9GAMM|nr:MAG: hypothetical protein BECKMB1821I_GA0114274_11017 [Candidatus Kentron sp. MB]VFK76985.1 MAG: hypothetical protein BECKMB1821H_GA0114242_10887 [Candidatus Kentron sp. MB]